jgi:hypothetical protein
MKILSSLFGYLKWHYTKALMTAFSFWKNILVYLINLFSIKSLLGNFFAPWKRLGDSYPRKFDLQKILSTFIVNTTMRIVGILLRSILLIIGLSCCTIYIILLPLTLVLWLILPIAIFVLVIGGLKYLIFS